MSLAMLWTCLYGAWIVLEVVVSVATRTRRSEAKVQDRGTQFLLWAVIVLSLTLSGWMQHLELADMQAGDRWLRLASVALLAAGLAVRITAILTLGRWFSANVATHAEQTIQRKGLFRFVRHPSYLGHGDHLLRDRIAHARLGLPGGGFRASHACGRLSHSYRGSSSARRVWQ